MILTIIKQKHNPNHKWLISPTKIDQQNELKYYPEYDIIETFEYPTIEPVLDENEGQHIEAIFLENYDYVPSINQYAEREIKYISLFNITDTGRFTREFHKMY